MSHETLSDGTLTNCPELVIEGESFFFFFFEAVFCFFFPADKRRRTRVSLIVLETLVNLISWPIARSEKTEE